MSIAGDFKIPIEKLVKPPPQFMLRDVNNPFVDEIVKAYNPMQGFGFSRLPVAIVDQQMFVASESSQHQYYTLGGNHLREAISKLQASGRLHKDHQTIWVTAYR